MQRIISPIHQRLAWIFLAALLLQFYLAGTGMFGAGSLGPHRMLGSALTMVAILFPVLALVGRLGRRLLGLSLLLVFLTIIQGMLPSLRNSATLIAALHPINALALMGISARIGRSGTSSTSRGSGNEPAQPTAAG
jgi:hypothetical protein